MLNTTNKTHTDFTNKRKQTHKQTLMHINTITKTSQANTHNKQTNTPPTQTNKIQHIQRKLKQYNANHTQKYNKQQTQTNNTKYNQ